MFMLQLPFEAGVEPGRSICSFHMTYTSTEQMATMKLEVKTCSSSPEPEQNSISSCHFLQDALSPVIPHTCVDLETAFLTPQFDAICGMLLCRMTTCQTVTSSLTTTATRCPQWMPRMVASRLLCTNPVGTPGTASWSPCSAL